MDREDKFYLGRIFDPVKNQTTDEPLLYDPDDLTTHAFVTGMTGSGKTGLCIGLLEEAALQGIPALMIDPKGDITNALLHFPGLNPQDFQPWINPDQARRDGKSIEQAAVDEAATWKKGLAQWGIGPERLRALSDSAQFAIYTPGSDAGIPVSILASLKAPPIPWEANRELLREKISSTVTALLGLVGMQDVDPVRSREHILLANIFEHAWSQGRDLDLNELILQTQNPPFSRLGAFDVNTFFPERDRFQLAMLLNNILAAPAFQSWIEGQPLEIANLLYATDGRPRHSVFYIAHLPDAERMFFVTLLYSALETWMRTQTGISSLRAIIYFDEIFGYLPPVSNPPSKQPMMRMLKQARAFGVAQVLASQNPVDMDYKALSNSGTWFIGKLQTEQDKQRLLDGLESATGGGLNRGEYDRLISALGKRIFLLHNVHERHPQLFQTRWAMNYLAGPLTRVQIPVLNELAGVGKAAVLSTTAAAPVGTGIGPAATAGPELAVSAEEQRREMGSETKPAVPSGIAEYILPNNITFTQSFQASGRSLPDEAYHIGLLYRPVLLAQAHVSFLQRKYNLEYQLRRAALLSGQDATGLIPWDEYPGLPVELSALDAKPDPQGRFAVLESPLTDPGAMKSMEKDFEDWAYRTSQAIVRANESLNIYVGPDVSQSEYRAMCTQAAREHRDEELAELSASFDKKIERLKDLLSKEERELREDEGEHSQRKMEELGTHAENVLSLFVGRSRRRLSTSLSKRRMTEKAKADVEESREAIEDYTEEIADLEAEKAQALEEVNEKWREIAEGMSEITVTPYKKDVKVELFGVAWMPYHIVKIGDALELLPGYSGK